MLQKITYRFTGLVLSLILTLIAYFIIVYPTYFNLDIKTAVIIIFSLALVQSLVQLIFFINVWREKGAFWNLAIFLSTATLIFIIIFFSIWIMDHLNYNMMG